MKLKIHILVRIAFVFNCKWQSRVNIFEFISNGTKPMSVVVMMRNIVGSHGVIQQQVGV